MVTGACLLVGRCHHHGMALPPTAWLLKGQASSLELGSTLLLGACLHVSGCLVGRSCWFVECLLPLLPLLLLLLLPGIPKERVPCGLYGVAALNLLWFVALLLSLICGIPLFLPDVWHLVSQHTLQVDR